MPNLEALVEDAYKLFAPYTIGSTLCVCKACCVTDAEEQALVATPLRQVPAELLQYGYFDSVCYHSDREHWEMKHFLPRVLELVSRFEFPRFTPEVLFDRLDFDQPARWPHPERALLTAFALAFFERCLAVYPLPSGDALAEILILFGLAHFELAPLLVAWAAANTPTSLAHLSHLLLDDFEDALADELKLWSPFSRPEINRQLAAWLGERQVRVALAAQLERAISQHWWPDAQLAARASQAHEVLVLTLL